MQGVFLRKYGVQTTIDFQLFETDGKNFKADAVYAAGDAKIMKDEASETNAASGFADRGQGYSITLTAAEMQAARIIIYIVDQTNPKAWLDTAIAIETYGNANAMHAFDLNAVWTAPDNANITNIHNIVKAGGSGDCAAIKSQTERGEKAAKVLLNKAVQDKLSGEIVFYDDNGVTPILTITPTETDSQITRTPS